MRRKQTKWVFIGLILTALVFSYALRSSLGQDEEAQTQAASNDSSNAPALKLKVAVRQAQAHRRMITLYGTTESRKAVDLQAQTQGNVIAIPAKEGQFLQKGEVIIEIDPRDRPARLEQAKALLKQREIEFSAARRLRLEGFQTEIRLAEAKTRLEEAKVNLKQIELDLSYAKLTAPFDGILERVNVEIGDFVGVGVFGVEGALARMVALDPMVVVGYLTEKDRPFIALNSTATARLADGREHEGRVSYLANMADSKNRTFRLEVELVNKDGRIASGISAEIAVPAQEVEAYFISPAMLSLNDKGEVGVKHLDDENRVLFTKVEIIEDSQKGMWVGGLPPQIRLITLGQAYVSAGQVVDAERIEDGQE